MLAAKNYVLAWSPDKPDIEANIEQRPEEDKISYIKKELDHFVNHELPAAINGSDMWAGYKAVRDSVSKKSAEAGVSIDFVALDEQHVEIKLTGSESYEELKQKCELARCEMRKYRIETKVLEEVESAIQRWLELRNDSYFKDYVAEDFVALYVIENIEKSAVKEDDIRQVLRTLSLPDDHVITIRRYGYTSYRLPENAEARQRLLKEAKLENCRRKYLQKIMKAVRPLEKGANVMIDLNENLEPKSLLIEVYKRVDRSEETERDRIIRDLKAKVFSTDLLSASSWSSRTFFLGEYLGKVSHPRDYSDLRRPTRYCMYLW
jgi:hypothetical protein